LTLFVSWSLLIGYFFVDLIITFPGKGRGFRAVPHALPPDDPADECHAVLMAEKPAKQIVGTKERIRHTSRHDVCKPGWGPLLLLTVAIGPTDNVNRE
jgi:hypothetical protein